MMSVQGPHDIRCEQAPTHSRDSFGPQGAELIRELRRIETLLSHNFSGTPLASRGLAEGERAPNSNARIAAVTFARDRALKAAMHAWLDEAGPGRTADDRDEETRARAATSTSRSARSGTSRAHQGAEHAGRAAADSITNILELPIGRLGSPRPKPDGAGGSAGTCANPGPRRKWFPARPQALIDSLTRTARFWLRHVAAGYGFLIGDTPPQGARAGDPEIGPDLCGRLRRGFELELRTGLRVLVLGAGLAGGWAVAVPLSAAVTVAGTLVVESDVKKIQHPVGGVIAQLPAYDGMRVKAGDLLARLDETQVRTNRQVITNQLDQIRVRMARLIAERDGLDEPTLPGELAPAGDPDIERLLASERALFTARSGARQNQRQLLQSNISQLGEEIIGIDAQIKSKTAQLALISSELQGVQTLYDKQLVPLARLTALQRQAAQLDGERSQLTSAIAETRSKISQAQLQIIKIDQDLRSEVMKDLRESQDKESELSQRVVAAQDQLNRIEIRAPTAGVVHQLSVHTIGGVIAAGQVIMEIVPDSDGLQIESRLPPVDIDQVRVGQRALVRFSAFNQRTTPQVDGVVSYVSADLTQEPHTGSAYYTIRMTLPGDERRRLGSLQLVSGMPAEVFLQTGSRTMMSYLLKPITDQLQRTFSER
ncbi:MAG: rane fusion protein type secretion system [Sphingomonadales bacterium]|nr:rane fusion protein type secretion system [Sphingomonadales bacterium]